MSGWFTSFFNARLCRNGEIIEGEQLVVSDDTGEILYSTGYIGGDAVDLEDMIIAPGFLELQTNGVQGFHFTQFDEAQNYAKMLDKVAKYLPSTGVTGFYPTIPTVSGKEFKQILPLLSPREIEDGASIMGAHAEGPYLHPSKKGAHNEHLFETPASSPSQVYGSTASSSGTLKLVTLAPELPNSFALIQDLTGKGIKVSLGHSTATFAEGLAAIQAGATGLTHSLNAMAPLHHREPGLAGLITAPPSNLTSTPYFSIIPDGHHLHPSVATMLFRSDPAKCMLVTDSIELAGLPDGTYPGHAQIPHQQTKCGTKVTIQGTDTLVGGCASLQDCIKNLMQWSGCDVAQAVRCVTENVADFMGDQHRGKLESGRRADLVVLDDEGTVWQTWVAGKKVWERR
nr:n-acetylglucosamine-6-phosphate deacetylase [Quercus suber]